MITEYKLIYDETFPDKCISRCSQKGWYIGSIGCQQCYYNVDNDVAHTNFFMKTDIIRCRHPEPGLQLLPIIYKIEFNNDKQFGINTKIYTTPCPHPILKNHIPKIGDVTCKDCRYNNIYVENKYIVCSHPDANNKPDNTELQLR